MKKGTLLCLILLVTVVLPISAEDPPGYDKPRSHLCIPVEISLFAGSRFHVKCSEPSMTNLIYFAMPMSDPAASSAFALCLSAYEKAAAVIIEFVPADRSGEKYGCLKTDCRNIKTVWSSNDMKKLELIKKLQQEQ